MLLVAMYLLTNTHSNMIGLYYLPLPYIVNDIGLDYETILELMVQLKKLDFCDYDDDHEYVWIKSFAEDQTGLNLKEDDKRVKAIDTLLNDIPDLYFMEDFYTRYGEHYHLIDYSVEIKEIEPKVIEIKEEEVKKEEIEQFGVRPLGREKEMVTYEECQGLAARYRATMDEPIS